MNPIEEVIEVAKPLIERELGAPSGVRWLEVKEGYRYLHRWIIEKPLPVGEGYPANTLWGQEGIDLDHFYQLRWDIRLRIGYGPRSNVIVWRAE